jgi:ABC-type uncharacterized transport system substrate-binding protein
MVISLDYDDTYTRDPRLWDAFITAAKASGHTVYCVTMRYRKEGADVVRTLTGKVDNIFFTERRNKHDFMFEQGISVNVWIDDMPWFILHDARK